MNKSLLVVGLILLAAGGGIRLGQIWRRLRLTPPTVERRSHRAHVDYAAELWQVPRRKVTDEMRRAARRDLLNHAMGADVRVRLAALNRCVGVPPLPDDSPLVREQNGDGS